MRDCGRRTVAGRESSGATGAAEQRRRALPGRQWCYVTSPSRRGSPGASGPVWPDNRCMQRSQRCQRTGPAIGTPAAEGPCVVGGSLGALPKKANVRAVGARRLVAALADWGRRAGAQRRGPAARHHPAPRVAPLRVCVPGAGSGCFGACLGNVPVRLGWWVGEPQQPSQHNCPEGDSCLCSSPELNLVWVRSSLACAARSKWCSPSPTRTPRCARSSKSRAASQRHRRRRRWPPGPPPAPTSRCGNAGPALLLACGTLLWRQRRQVALQPGEVRGW